MLNQTTILPKVRVQNEFRKIVLLNFLKLTDDKWEAARCNFILRHCCNNALGQINQLLNGFQVNVKVPFGAKFLDAALCVLASVKDARTAIILTHGAGGDMNFRQLRSLAHTLASAGFICMRFTCKSLNLGYRVKAYRAVWVSIFNYMNNRLF